jgi:glutamate 5-kinase
VQNAVHFAFDNLNLTTGTTSIVDETTYQPLLSIVSAVVEVVVQLRNLGYKVVLISSAAIAVGMKRMDIPNRPKSLSEKQVSFLM